MAPIHFREGPALARKPRAGRGWQCGTVIFLRKEKAGSPIASILLGNILVALIGLPFMLKAPSLGEGGL